MSAWVLLAIPTGLALGLGLWTLMALVPRIGAPRLSARVAPYLLDVSREARAVSARRPSEPASLLTGLARPTGTRIHTFVTTVLGGDEGIERRLRQSGARSNVARFRSQQLLAAATGAAIGVAGVVVAARSTSVSPAVMVLVVLVCAAVGLLAPEQLLAASARRRQARMADELPTVLELLSLSLSAGEGILDAVRRVAAAGNGELARELGRVVAEVNAGMPLTDALLAASSQIGLAPLTRTIDQLVGAIDRGTPLVEVFRAQAQDSRDDTKRQLLEAAGKKEVAMLVPLVFAILPTTIAFAIFPGVMVLQLGF
jgi:tight adherence protein C